MKKSNTPENRRPRIYAWILGSTLTICWGQHAHAGPQLPGKSIFQLIEGRGIDVCEAYLQLLKRLAKS